MNFESIKITDEKYIKKILRTVNQKFDLSYHIEGFHLYYRRHSTTEDYTFAELCVVTEEYQLNLNTYYTKSGKMDTCKGNIIMRDENNGLTEKDVLDNAYSLIEEHWDDIFENELEKVTDSINHILSTKQNFLN